MFEIFRMVDLVRRRSAAEIPRRRRRLMPCTMTKHRSSTLTPKDDAAVSNPHTFAAFTTSLLVTRFPAAEDAASSIDWRRVRGRPPFPLSLLVADPVTP